MTYFQNQFEGKEFKKLSKFTKTDTLEEIMKLFYIYKQISVSKISEFLNLDEFNVLNYLIELESSNEIIKMDDKKEISCNICSSVNIKYLFHCPECYVEDFDKNKLIEHCNCGAISLETDYTNNICPNCSEEIKTLGIDYKVTNNMFVCSLCLEKFLEPVMNLTCEKCKNLFKLKDAKWKNSSWFSLSKNS